MRTFVVMYHKFCQDGFCSAAIAHLYFLQLSKFANEKFRIIYNPVEAGRVDAAIDELITRFPETENFRVLSFDLSFTYRAAVNLFRHFPDAQVVDHHKTTNEECFRNAPEGVSEEEHFKNVEIFSKQLHFDNSRSGAALAFQFFFTDSKMPKLVEYIEDRDLWAWKLPDSKAISAGIYRHLNMYYVNPDKFSESSPLSMNDNITFECADDRIPVFDKWIEWMLSEDWTEKSQAEGEIVLDVQNKIMFPLYKMGKAYVIDGQRVFVVNSASLISELGNAICEWCDDELVVPAYDYALIWRYDAPKDLCYISLRSLQDSDNDVEIVAKKNGGGGHKHAAGFEMSLQDLFRVFNTGTWKV